MKFKLYLPKVILSVLLTIIIILSSICTAVKMICLDENTLCKIIDEKNISENVYNNIESSFASYSHTSGIDKEVFMSAIDIDDVDGFVKGNIKNALMYCRSETEIYENCASSELIENSINDFFADYAREIDYTPDDVYYQKIDEAVSYADETLKNETDIIKLTMISEEGILDTVRNYYDLFEKALIVLYISIAVLAGAIIIMSIHERIVYWLGINLFSSGIILFVPCIICIAGKVFDSFVIKQKSMYTFVTAVFYKTAYSLLFLSAVFIAAGILSVLYNVVKTAKQRTE